MYGAVDPVIIKRFIIGFTAGVDQSGTADPFMHLLKKLNFKQHIKD